MAQVPERVQFEHDGVDHIKDKEDASIPSAYQRRISIRDVDGETAYVDDEAIDVRESDLKKRQVFRGWTLMWLAYQATGVIYGDIGTSPLYVYSSTFSSAPSHADLLGALSLIIWTLTLMVTIKYILIVLRADDEGEGGTFAIYTLLSRYCNIIKRDPRAESLVKMERYGTNELAPSNRGVRTWLEQSSVAHAFLKILAVLGVSLIMADGILTPAQSILGAIQGLEVVKPDISNHTIVGAACGILVLLFIVQPLGIHRISSVFAPIVIIWLLFNACAGIYNLALHDWTVLKAFSPYFAGQWFVRNKTEGWLELGGILLAFTGVETLFADLGAFSRRAVQISWLFLAYPCLLLAYIGQAAYISVDPSAYDNPFFKTVPPGSLYFSLVISVLATVVASQATVTSTFQLLSQIMHNSYFPHIQMIHKSDRFHGQVYVPIANWLLMIGTVVVTAVYNNTDSLGHAYGFCVVMVTFITTNLVTLVALIVWRIHPAIVFVVWLPFVTLDGLYLSSAATKIPDGAWFTLLLAILLASFFSLWRYGKEAQWSCEARDQVALSGLVQKDASTTSLESSEKPASLRLTPRYGGDFISRMDALGIFFDKGGARAAAPAVYEHWLRKVRSHPRAALLLHLRAQARPYVAEEDRFTVAGTAVPGVYRIVLRHGYKDRVVTPDLARLAYEEVRRAIAAGALLGDTAAASGDRNVAIAAQLRSLDDAYAAQPLFLVGKEKMRIAPRHNFFARMLLGLFLWVRENSRGRIEKLDVPVDQIVEVGFIGEI